MNFKYTFTIITVLFCGIGINYLILNSSEAPDISFLETEDESFKKLSEPASSMNIVEIEKAVPPEQVTNMMEGIEIPSEELTQFINTLPMSLRDLPSPSPLKTDHDGHLIIDQSVKQLFELYLTALGEEPIENIITRIKYVIETQTKDLAQEEALELLESYLQYKNNLGHIKNSFAHQAQSEGFNLSTIKEMKLMVRESRLSYFSEETTSAFFQKEDQYDDFMMAQTQILHNNALSLEDKKEQIHQLEEATPSWIIESDRKAHLVSKTREEEEKYRSEGATQSDIYHFRESVYGSEAAENLRQLDIERTEWKRKVEDYRVELGALMAGTSPDSINVEVIEDLRAQTFNDSEIIRIRALDKIDLGLH